MTDDAKSDCKQFYVWKWIW